MSIKQTDTTISLTIPSIPVLSQYASIFETPTTIDVPVERLKTGMRLIVIISTYLLFRPHLEKLFRTITGRQSAEEANIKERMEFLKQQGQGQGQNAGKKVYAVATSQDGGASPVTPGSGKKRRKA